MKQKSKAKSTKNRQPTEPLHYHEPLFMAKLDQVYRWIEEKTGKAGFVDMRSVLKYVALYYVIFGMRSNGKTTGAMICAAIRFFLYGEPSAIIRRFDEDIKGKAAMFWGSLEKLGLIEYLSNGRWNSITYRGRIFYLSHVDADGERTTDKRPFCFAFALTQWQHDKGATYPGTIGTIIFDEFMTRGQYLQDEFTLFTNTLSTILRDDGKAKIFMLGNTVSYFCPYFREMGLKHLREMQPGDMALYTGLHKNCKTLVFYSDGIPGGKETDQYFAFDNPKLKMITEGRFEMAVYPHCPRDFGKRDIVFSFFIDFDGELLRGDVISLNGGAEEWIYMTPKTTPLKDPDHDLIYSDKDDPRPNWRRRITRPITPAEKAIANLFRAEKVFYADNQTGETVRIYVLWCDTARRG